MHLHERRAAALLSESARWRLLSLMFERPRQGWQDELLALTAEVRDTHLEAAARAAAEVDEGSYLAVLGPGGAVSPREAGYRPMGDPGKILAALRGFYDAFGYDPRAEDPPDHVAVQTGFVGFLKLKQAYAAARDDTEGERTAAEAVSTFVKEHLSGFVGKLASDLQGKLEHLEIAASLLDKSCPVAREPLPRVTPQVSFDAEESEGGFACDGHCCG